MVKIISGITHIAIQAAGLLEEVNLFALGLLHEGSLANLFWTLVLTGSVGMAIPVILLSYTSDLFKHIMYR